MAPVNDLCSPMSSPPFLFPCSTTLAHAVRSTHTRRTI